MSVSIPSAAGVPGVSGPPDWFSGGAGQSFKLDDVRWRGAIKRTYGSGVSGSNFFRATQVKIGPDQFIYLTFRAAFVQELADQSDMVYLGLRKHNDATAMVIRIQAHGPAFTPAGPPAPPANPPIAVFSVQVSTLSGGNWVPAATPAWITADARTWLQSSADVPADPNNRWAVQMRIPVKTSGGITNNAGPELGTDFDVWYLLHGSAGGNPVILADYRLTGSTTEGDLILATYPQPNSVWDEFKLTAVAGTTGGVAILQNDVFVKNAAFGTGTTIDNHQANAFIARPRNYTGASIPAGDINATFRIANFGSVGGNAEQYDLSTGMWDYVPGNSELVPVLSSVPIPVLMSGDPPATSEIKLDVAQMDLPPNKSRHQCVLVTLSGTNLNFLNDAVYQNMNYDVASLLEREAEISIVGLKPFSPVPRDVYLAVEKINMAKTTPGGNEGEFLSGSMARLIKQGGPLAEKLESARAKLPYQNGGGDHNLAMSTSGSPHGRLNLLVDALSAADLSNDELDQLFPTFRVHVYHDTGERVTQGGEKRPVLREQSAFGLYVYHEGTLEGWQTSIQGAQRIADNLYLLAVPNNSAAKVTARIQAVQPGEQRIPEDPIKQTPTGCLGILIAFFKKLFS